MKTDEGNKAVKDLNDAKQHIVNMESKQFRLEARLKSYDGTVTSDIAKLLNCNGYTTDDIYATIVTILDALGSESKALRDMTSNNTILRKDIQILRREHLREIKSLGERLDTSQRECSGLMLSCKRHNENIENQWAIIEELRGKLGATINERDSIAECVVGERNGIKKGDYVIVMSEVDGPMHLCQYVGMTDGIIYIYLVGRCKVMLGHCRRADWDEVFPKGQRISVKYYDGTMAGIIKASPEKDSTKGPVEALVEFCNKSVEWVEMDRLTRRA